MNDLFGFLTGLGGTSDGQPAASSPAVTTGPSQGHDWASTIGDLLTGYAAARAKLDLENRSDDINQPDRVDAATATQDALNQVAQSSPLGNPWVWAGIAAAGIVGGILVYKVL